MIECRTNMWKAKVNAWCITTNGDVNQSGEAVMGRGCALEAKSRFPGLAVHFGNVLLGTDLAKISVNLFSVPASSANSDYTRRVFSANGPDRNHVWDLGTWGRYQLISFPVKHHWYERANLELIARSAEELVELVDLNRDWIRVILPRPGCGNGSLDWNDVKPVLEERLDDRFILVSK